MSETIGFRPELSEEELLMMRQQETALLVGAATLILFPDIIVHESVPFALQPERFVGQSPEEIEEKHEVTR